MVNFLGTAGFGPPGGGVSPHCCGSPHAAKLGLTIAFHPSGHEGAIIEVRISDIHARDEFHRHSKNSCVATSVICGPGPYGYIAALQTIAQMK
jgi:3-dehydroquinate dehydratase